MKFVNGWTKAAVFALAAVGVDAKEAAARVDAGMLTCEVGKGFALILSKPRDLHCVFHKSNGQNEAYGGKLREFGLDVGVSGRGVIAWEVIAATSAPAPGALAGTYSGIQAGAAAVIGGRGRLLIGGAENTVSLQPLSVQGETGLNLALGVASMSLHPLMTGRPRAGTRAPAVGHSHAAIPHTQQVPHYGCGSYTHLQRGQTLSGLAHACNVTLEALLDANSQITNVRDIDAGALVHLPSHVGHHASSPCGDRAILGESESLDHLAWRCGVTLHALLLENPNVRDMAMIEPGLVLAIPEKSVPATEPPVQYALNETEIVETSRFVTSDASPTYPVPRPSPLDDQRTASGLSARDQARLEVICVNEATNRYGLRSGDVFATNSVSASGQTFSVTLDANGDDGVCLIDRGGNVLFVTDLSSSSRRGTAAAAVAGAVVGGSLAAIASNSRSSDGVARSKPARSAPTGGNYVPEEDFFQVSLSSANSALNVHSAPSTGAPTVGRLANGAILRNAGGCQYPGGRQWCDVQPSNGGVRGWVAGEFLAIPRPGSGVAAAATTSDGTDLQASSAYDQGCTAGAEDASINMSMAHERHSGEYDSQYEDTFRAGYEKCWAENRQEAQQAPSPEASGAATTSGGTDMQASAAYDQGCAAGTEDASVNMSMAYERHSGNYDSHYEDTFRAGYEKCWAENRQEVRAGASSSSDVSNAATRACLSAVSNQTNERNVSVMSSEFSEANSMVMIGVGANRAPWRCLVSNDGTVQEVMFTGDDSAGVDQSATPIENTATADDGGGAMAGSSSSDVSAAAVQACRSAIDDQTDGDISVLSTEFSEANSLVMIGVGSNQAPWRCLVSNDGAVQDISFAGDEGKL